MADLAWRVTVWFMEQQDPDGAHVLFFPARCGESCPVSASLFLRE